MDKNPYKVESKKNSRSGERTPIYGVHGPRNSDGKGNSAFSYYSDRCFPQYSFDSEEKASIVCDMVNAAYVNGYKAALSDFKKFVNQ